MPAPISREYRIYLAIWRKALKSSPEPVRVNCGNPKMAIAMRQGMYRAIRPFRRGEIIDKELLDAAEKFVIYLDPKREFIEVRPRQTLEILDEMFDTLGIDEEDLLLGTERKVIEEAEASLSKFLEEKPRATPFYTRED